MVKPTWRSSRRTVWIGCVTAAVVALSLIMGPSAAPPDGESGSENDCAWRSKSGRYCVTYRSRLDPITINRIHSWVLHVETPEGVPVDHADIAVDGGMPAHDHGLPTSPRVTKYLGNGDYLVEGMRFHMNGYWEIVVTVEAGGRPDRVILPLEL